ncbi:MAG TPA: hypothetical protein EYO73_03515 [Sulfurimonas sp.]|nr:hypothetical protein [Sulfurimonas sp.]
MTGLEKLKGIGAHKIFERTHIARKFVEDILNKQFSRMSKIQFMGFTSILERDYNIDLHELKEDYLKSSSTQDIKGKEPFIVSQQTETDKNSVNKNMYILVGILVLGALYMLLKPESTSEPLSKPQKNIEVQSTKIVNELKNSTIEKAKLNLNSLGATKSLIKDKTDIDEVVVEPIHTSKFEVSPKSKLWIGIVDLETFKRTQKISSRSFELDPDKEWLLVMGHGYVKFEVNGVEKSYRDESKVWFSYENASLSKLTRSEFKEKNRGKSW